MPPSKYGNPVLHAGMEFHPAPKYAPPVKAEVWMP